jgi:inhibitor of KinA sporulation pathway (predicted exonuclease)
MHPDVDRLTGEIVIYDTEYTSWEGSMERGWSGQNEYRELIQIAAIRVDASNGFSEIEELEIFVKPQRNRVLSDYISSLTGITQRQIDDFGVHPETALRLFGNFFRKHRSMVLWQE